MAEIKIEKKNSIWPWIIGLIILALLIYFLAFNDRDEVRDIENEVEEVTSLIKVEFSETDFVVHV